MPVNKPYRVLSLDGGGVRGLSSLLILKAIFDRLNSQKGGDPVEPWQVFDLIGGTSTGGIIAIMLGRLKMSIDDCIDCYKSLSEAVFLEKQQYWSRALFPEDKLEGVVQEIVKSRTGDVNTPLLNRDQGGAKSMAFAIRSDNVNSEPTAFRSFLSTSTTDVRCAIWEAIRATSAAPVFFKPMTIQGIDYVDGGLKYNNPADQLYLEAKTLLRERDAGPRPPSQKVLLISLGTGRAKNLNLTGGHHMLTSLLITTKSLSSIATDTESIHGYMKRTLSKDLYFRFQVDSRLADVRFYEYKKLSQITTATSTYVESQGPQICQCASALLEVLDRPTEVPTLTIATVDNSSMPMTPSFEHPFSRSFSDTSTICPAMNQSLIPYTRNTKFTGREDILKRLEEFLFAPEDNETIQSQKRAALSGLGGIGKSQIAVEFAYRICHSRPSIRVIWVHASSAWQIMADLQDYMSLNSAPSLVVQDNAALHTIYNHLQDARNGAWLLIVDNADRDELFSTQNPLRFIPSCPHGRLLFTSRNDHLASKLTFDESRVLKIGSWSSDDAIHFFHSKNLFAESDRQDIEHLNQRLQGLPLALAQATSYMSHRKISVSEYLTLFDDEPLQLLGEGFASDEAGLESARVVSRTWEITFSHLEGSQPVATEIFKSMSLLHSQSARASWVRPYKCSDLDLMEALQVLKDYSFITERSIAASPPETLKQSVSDRRFDLHPLVHLVTRNWIASPTVRDDLINQVLRNLDSNLPVVWQGSLYETVAPVEAHLQQILGHKGVRIDLVARARVADRLACCLAATGRSHLAAKYHKETFQLFRQAQGRTSFATIDAAERIVRSELSIGNCSAALFLAHKNAVLARLVHGFTNIQVEEGTRPLAEIRCGVGRFTFAIARQRRMVRRVQRLCGHQSTDAARAEGTLIACFHLLGHYEKAYALQQRLYQYWLTQEGPQSAQTFGSLGCLLSGALVTARFDQAEEHLELMISATEKTFDDDHPHRLSLFAYRSWILNCTGRHAEAARVLATVVEKDAISLTVDPRDASHRLVYLALTQLILDEDDQAISTMDDAATTLRRCALPVSGDYSLEIEGINLEQRILQDPLRRAKRKVLELELFDEDRRRGSAPAMSHFAFTHKADRVKILRKLVARNR